MKLCALLTTFNRCEKTVQCLKALEVSAANAGIFLRAVLVDDGSADGTVEAVKERFSWVEVIVNCGPPLFWCRGMHRALDTALHQGYDYYLMLNDDTVLMENSLSELLKTECKLKAECFSPVIVVGSTRDEVFHVHSYGGHVRKNRWLPLTFGLLHPSEQPQAIDTFHGNIVLLPKGAVERIGNLDPVFEHAMGDTDYGLRARWSGVGIWLAPGFHGYCSYNPIAGTAKDSNLSLKVRWEIMFSRKGLPWRSWLHMTRRHTGLCWPIFFLWPYAKLVLIGVLNIVRR